MGEKMICCSGVYMFTDKEIIELHADKKYKKTNGFFKNVHLSHAIIKSGIGGVSVSISTAGTMSISVAIISMFWTILRYKFITKEITNCRSRIIEGLLNTGFVIAPDKLIKDSIRTGTMWLEYNRNKVEAVGGACIEYIETAEHRVILATYSYINDNDSLAQAFQNARSELERIFKLVNDELIQKEIKEAMLEYSSVLNNAECIPLLKGIFSENSYAGNLTTASGSGDYEVEGARSGS